MIGCFVWGRVLEDQPAFPSGLLRQGEVGGDAMQETQLSSIDLPRCCLWFRLEITAPSLYWVLEGLALQP